MQQASIVIHENFVKQGLDHIGLQGVEAAHRNHAAHSQQQFGVIRFQHRLQF